MEDALFVITEVNQEHRSQEATQKSNSAPTASKEIVGLSLQELCALIISEVSIAIQLPTKQHPAPPLSPASAAAIHPVQEVTEGNLILLCPSNTTKA